MTRNKCRNLALLVGLLSFSCIDQPNALAKVARRSSPPHQQIEFLSPVRVWDDDGLECSRRDPRIAFFADDRDDDSAPASGVIGVPVARGRSGGVLVSPPLGSAITLTAERVAPRMKYQWQQKLRPDDDWHDLPGQHAPTLQLVPPGALDLPACPEFRCVMRSHSRAAVTETAYLVPQQPAPIIQMDLPAAVVVRDGESVNLRIRLRGARADVIRWHRERLPRGTPKEEESPDSLSDTVSLSHAPLMWISGDEYWFSTGPLHVQDDGTRYQVEAIHFGDDATCTQAGTTRSRTCLIYVRP